MASANFPMDNNVFSFIYSLLIVLFLILTAILKLCVALINPKKYPIVEKIVEEIPLYNK